MKKIAILLIATMVVVACKKRTEGENGRATIKGRIWVQDYDKDYVEIDTQYVGAKEDVFIIYGDEEIYGNDMETHFDGTYKFEYLTPGTYTIFAYSDNPDSKKSNLIPVKKTVEITDKDEVVTVDDIIIIRE